MFVIVLLGLLATSECEKKQCDVSNNEDNDPVGNNCYINDGFDRTLLYRAWRPACNDLSEHSSTLAREYFAYVLDHSDTLYYGTEIVIRCLTGYMLNISTHSYVRKSKSLKYL